jgi:LacI family transcriptional regulator
MAKIVTQHDIARAAGVSRSTVTRALRNDPQISKAVREEIVQIAQKLGYKANPLVSALMTQLRTGRSVPFHGCLAYLVFGWNPDAWHASAAQQALFNGAKERAEALGYKLELHWHVPKEMSDTRLGDVLHSRGMTGVLIPIAADLAATPPELPWSRFSAITLEFRLDTPRLNFVATDAFALVWLLLHALRERGYLRLGVILDLRTESASLHRMEGAVAAYQSSYVSPENKIPLLLISSETGDEVAAWISRWQPDVIAASSQKCLKGVIPDHFPVALFRTQASKLSCIGSMDSRLPQVGAAGVEMVVEQINRSELGIPETQKGILLEPVWRQEAPLAAMRA